jgi:hypothetical protein
VRLRLAEAAVMTLRTRHVSEVRVSGLTVSLSPLRRGRRSPPGRRLHSSRRPLDLGGMSLMGGSVGYLTKRR